MSDELKCPICGKAPRIKHWTELPDDDSIYCCGVTVDGGQKQWNQYAAAMELAKAMAKENEADNRMVNGEFEHYAEADRQLALLGHDIDEAAKRVLEVFNQPTGRG